MYHIVLEQLSDNANDIRKYAYRSRAERNDKITTLTSKSTRNCLLQTVNKKKEEQKRKQGELTRRHSGPAHANR